MEDQRKEVTRREFLGAAGLSAAILQRGNETAQWTAQERDAVEIVNDFCAAWATRDISKPLAFLSDDSVYRMSETTPPVKGHEGVIERLKSYVDVTDKLEFKVLQTAAMGPIVINHRIDSFVSTIRPVTWEGIGVFFVQNGKIKEWSDYTIRVTR